MPSPPKDRPSGRLGRLLAALRPSRAGPLPVQTGFPTSLADLVVKNHGRLKKQPSPSSKRGKRAAASPTTPSPAASPSPSPPPASPPPPPAPPAVAVSTPDRQRPDLPPAQAGLARSSAKGGGFALGLGFLAVIGVVSLALLVIWSKKVVAAVTVASFSLFLLESVRSRSFPRPAAASTEGRRLYLDGLGRVSPIRELDAETESTETSRPSCSDSDRGSEASALAAEEKSGVLDEPSCPRAKKRPWKKLIAGAKRLHSRGRKSKEADSPASSSFRSEGERAAGDGTARDDGNVKATTDPSVSRRGSANRPEVAAADAVAREPDSSSSGPRRSQGLLEAEIDASADDLIEQKQQQQQEEEDEQEQEGLAQAGIGFPAQAMVAVVLVGLVAGKLQAVALTVLCYAFFSSARRRLEASQAPMLL